MAIKTIFEIYAAIIGFIPLCIFGAEKVQRQAL
jgi:hypothetical protein